MSQHMVTIKIMPEEDNQVMALFSSTGVPNDVSFSLQRVETTKQNNLKALDLSSNLTFIGDNVTKNCDYYLGIRRNDCRSTLEVHPLSIYNMVPIVEIIQNNSIQELTQTPLSFKEQMDEMKEKFGSRRTQRSLNSRRKYAIEFGEEDVQQMDVQTNASLEECVNELTKESTINDSIDILPKQNRNAICVEEVYDINEIITENERMVLKSLEEELFNAIDNPFVKQLISNESDSDHKMTAIYIDLIITLLNLKPTSFRNADPLPTLNDSVKEVLFDKYLSTKNFGVNKVRYCLPPKQKDRLIINAVILCLRLYNYRPIDLEVLQKSLKIPIKQLRKIVEIIGCYIETMKNSSGVNIKTVVFKLPLNTFHENKKPFNRR